MRCLNKHTTVGRGHLAAHYLGYPAIHTKKQQDVITALAMYDEVYDWGRARKENERE